MNFFGSMAASVVLFYGVIIRLSPPNVSNNLQTNDSCYPTRVMALYYKVKQPRVFQDLRLPDFTRTAQDGDKIVSLTHRSPLPPVNAPGTHFC